MVCFLFGVAGKRRHFNLVYTYARLSTVSGARLSGAEFAAIREFEALELRFHSKSVVFWHHIPLVKSGFCPANRRGFAAAFRAPVPLATAVVPWAMATRALKQWTHRWL